MDVKGGGSGRVKSPRSCKVCSMCTMHMMSLGDGFLVPTNLFQKSVAHARVSQRLGSSDPPTSGFQAAGSRHMLLCLRKVGVIFFLMKEEFENITICLGV